MCCRLCVYALYMEATIVPAFNWSYILGKIFIQTEIKVLLELIENI